MNVKQKLAVSLILFLSILFCFRNHLRLYLLRHSVVTSSSVKSIGEKNEGNFTVSIYTCSRIFSRPVCTYFNRLFSDRIMVLKMPLQKIHVNNLMLKPIGTDEISGHPLFYFNTLFFMNDFAPTTGLIYEKKRISNRSPVKTRLGINDEGCLTFIQKGPNIPYENVLQVGITLDFLCSVASSC